MLNIFKNKSAVAEMKEKVDQLSLLESWHWNRFSYHRRRHDRISKRRQKAQDLLRVAEREFIKCSLEEK